MHLLGNHMIKQMKEQHQTRQFKHSEAVKTLTDYRVLSYYGFTKATIILQVTYFVVWTCNLLKRIIVTQV